MHAALPTPQLRLPATVSTTRPARLTPLAALCYKLLSQTKQSFCKTATTDLLPAHLFLQPLLTHILCCFSCKCGCCCITHLYTPPTLPTALTAATEHCVLTSASVPGSPLLLPRTGHKTLNSTLPLLQHNSNGIHAACSISTQQCLLCGLLPATCHPKISETAYHIKLFCTWK